LAGAALCGGPWLAGCSSPLTKLVGGAPNRLKPLRGCDRTPPLLELATGADDCFFVEVGPPPARLAVAVFEPAAVPQPLGTVLVVHGIFGRGLLMTRTAHTLAEAGYRAVVVDLRGHGRSSGDWLGYGAQEARDLVQVMDELESQGRIAGKLGVYGISYGATTSIHLAALDARIAAVVAVAPFSDIREEVPHFARTLVPAVGCAIPERAYQDALDRAGERGRFDPDSSNAADVIAQAQMPVLILHGTMDWLVPYRHGERLGQSANSRSELVAMPGLGHSTIFLDPLGDVHRKAHAWFDRWLQPTAKPDERAAGDGLLRPGVDDQGDSNSPATAARPTASPASVRGASTDSTYTSRRQ
jgi:pimeloyl-ACP methyl ester carboxylesterase